MYVCICLGVIASELAQEEHAVHEFYVPDEHKGDLEEKQSWNTFSTNLLNTVKFRACSSAR